MKDELTGRNYIAGPSSAVALGVFDGVHRGHRKVLEAAAESGFEVWALTFGGNVLPGAKSGEPLLTEPRIKYALMSECGVEHCFALDFDEVKDLSGEEFAERYLRDTFHCKMAFCGSDFRFGKDASCGAGELEELGREYGFHVAVIDKVCDGSEEISSTAIRNAVIGGDMAKAESMLGYPFCIYDMIVEGRHIGSKYSMPTINQKFDEGYIVPHYGVYASAVLIDGKFWPGVTNVGTKPTVSDEGEPCAETNIIGFSADMYGKEVPVFLLDLIRDEQKFESTEALFDQIRVDREKAGNIAVKWINKNGKKITELLEDF